MWSGNKRRNAIGWIVGGFLLTTAAVVVLEVTGRTYIHVRYGVPGKRYGRWRYDSVLGARMAENVYDHRWQTNNLGFRNDEDVVDPKAANCLRIIAYGGSTTLCWNLPTEQTWPRQLEARLREATGRACHQVLNAGDILWSLSHVYARAQTEIPALHPDFVIIYAGVNEVGNARYLAKEGRPMEELVASGNYGAFSRRLPQNMWLVRNSFAFRFLHKIFLTPLEDYIRDEEGRRWSKLLATELGPSNPQMLPEPSVLENYLYVLEQLIALCRRYDAEPIFVVQAYGLRTVGFENLTAYSREGARTALGLGVSVADAQHVVDTYTGNPMDLFRESGIHWSRAGASLFADYLHQTVFLARSEEPPLR